MADVFKSGFIGMGSKVYIGLQDNSGAGTTDYKITATSVQPYACPIQPGSRPAKQIESLQVDQLFPTFLRKKPLPSAVRVEGSYSMYFPIEKMLGANGTENQAAAEVGDRTSATWKGSYLDLWIRSMLGDKDPTIHGITTANLTSDAGEQLNQDDTTLEADEWLFAKYTMDTGIPALTFVHKLFEASSGELASQRFAVITGAKCSSSTFNFSADSPVTADFNFLALDERISEAPTGATSGASGTLYNNIHGITAFGMTSGIFGPTYGDTTLNESVRTADTATSEKTTDLFPNWSTQLFLKPSSTDTKKTHGTSINIGAAVGADTSGSDSSTAPYGVNGDYRIPFMDFSFTINNNLDYPTSNNGSQYPSEPILTATKEITGSLTLPFTDDIIDLLTGGAAGARKGYQFQDFLNLKNFELSIVLQDPSKETNPGSEQVVISFPEICFTGTALGDIPQGEITMPLSFAAYQPANISTDGTPSTLGTTQFESCIFFVGRQFQYTA